MLRRRLTSQIVSHIKYFLANIFFSSLKYFFATCYGGGWQLRTVSRTNWRTGTATGQSCGCYLRWPEQHHKWIILRNFVDTFTSWAWARSPWDICHSWAPACRARWRWLRWCWRRSSRTSACWGRGRWRGHPSTPVMLLLLLLLSQVTISPQHKSDVYTLLLSQVTLVLGRATGIPRVSCWMIKQTRSVVILINLQDNNINALIHIRGVKRFISSDGISVISTN